jgi:hypothetical protein
MLSHGEEEIGIHPKVHKMIEEVYRVLKPGGSFCLVSGNDTFVTFPYLMQDTLQWDIKVDSLSSVDERKKKKGNTTEGANNFGKLNVSYL